MAQQSRSLYKDIFRNFINSFKTIKYKGELKGKDSFGTKYYELQGAQSKKPSRWFVPVTGSFDQEVPVEWQAWLRHKRKNPPTEDEIRHNLQIMNQTVQKAKELEKPNLKDNGEITSPNKISFPTYEEYSLHPESGKSEKSK